MLYSIESRLVNRTVFVKVVSKRPPYEACSAEKAIPLVVEYDVHGKVKLIGASEILDSAPTHPYKANSPKFSEERLADLEVSNIMKHLEHFPTLPLDANGQVHPIAEAIYGSMIYLRPDKELENALKKFSFVDRCDIRAKVLEKVVKSLSDIGINIDIFSVPKRKVGTFAYLSEGGIAKVAKTFSFGFHNAIPCDRIARELSSLKSAEKFIKPSALPFKIADKYKPYITMVRVGIIATEDSMLDSADICPTGMKKLACKLERKVIVKDVSMVPMEKRNVIATPYKAGINLVHEEVETINELDYTPGPIRLVMPNGVKVAGQQVDYQATDGSNPIDLIMEFETFAKKGALSIFAMSDPTNYTKGMNLEDVTEHFHNLQTQKIIVNDQEYMGYIIDIPVIRPGQRYTELCVKKDVSFDTIAHAITNTPMVPDDSLESRYQDLKNFRKSILTEIYK